MMHRLLRLILGSLLILLGLLGLVLPLLQGWLLLALGGLVLSQDVPLFAKMVCWITARFPRVGQAAQRLMKAFSVNCR
jgi:hypothetical protein